MRQDGSHKKRKVFVVSRGYHDYTPAKKFGELHYLSDAYIHNGSASTIMREFADILVRESSPDDYVLVSGLALMNAIAFFIFGVLHRHVNVLTFNKRTGDYDDRSLNGDELLAQYHELLAADSIA